MSLVAWRRPDSSPRGESRITPSSIIDAAWQHRASLFVGDVHGGTLMFRRSLFAEGLRYPEVNLAEDATFLRDAMHRGRRLARLANPGLFVYVRHGRNAWQFEVGRFLDPRGWEAVAGPPSLPGEMIDAYRAAVTAG